MKRRILVKDYYLGLDVGTNSVGWAVTDENYELCNFRGKDMWGIRLFDGAETAADRRIIRNTRRRLDRRRQRLELLQDIFAEEIYKKDPNFFIKLNESYLHLEDKSLNIKYPLFNDKNYTDIEYYSEYPTIFHLRKKLIESTEKNDIRLIYLALHNIIKYRGHFLIEGELSSVKNFEITFTNALSIVEEQLGYLFTVDNNDFGKIENILSDKKLYSNEKIKQIKALLSLEILDGEKTSKEIKDIVDAFCKLIVGNKANLGYFFDLREVEELKKTIKFSEEKYEEEILPFLENDFPDQALALESIKSIYNWQILVDILKNEDYLSFAKVKDYESHKDNLNDFKYLMKKYLKKDKYRSFFNDENEKESYSAYIGHVIKNNKKYHTKDRIDQEDFSKYVGKILDEIEKNTDISAEDKKILENLKIDNNNQSIFPLQRSTDNAVIPNQVHTLELDKILENASKHYDFLNEKDSDSLTNLDKIKSIMKFRIPYFVGPLSDRHQDEGSNSWIVRREGRNDRIYPWNIEEIVDYEKSNEIFINRMTNKCTYLYDADVIPNASLLYSKFKVLNELNNLKIRNKKISVELKQRIYTDLFMEKSRVTGKMLLNYLKIEDSELREEDLSGFDKDFNNSLKSYLDFKRGVFFEDPTLMNNAEVNRSIEEIIKWITIYGEDKKTIKGMINKAYSDIYTAEQVKKICTFRYSSWGRFSEEFLNKVEGASFETGEVLTIIDTLWETNDNLMQILSSRYSFSEEIDEINSKLIGNIDEVSYDALVKDLYVSPSNKRAIWQTIKITEEIKKIMGCEPKRIFVEMARSHDEKKRTKSRKDNLLDLYANCQSDTRKWTEEISQRDERDFNSRKLYLYYTQMGRCMYSSKEIDIDELMKKNSKWDIDHIYPQSKIKDDSLNNLVLVSKTINSKKSNELLNASIQSKQEKFWLGLLQKGFISKEKYNRLMRREDFSSEELSSFINRQLVETRQSTKIITDLFENMYEDSKVIYVKANLVSDFRYKTIDSLKSRLVNDFHHAKDAYLNIVVGNAYYSKFTSNPANWIKKNRDKGHSIRAIFNFDIGKEGKLAWKAGKNGTRELVKRTIDRDNILYTEMTYCENGKLFLDTKARKGENSGLPIKKGLDREKYGGYKGIATSYFALVEFEKKGKTLKNITGVPIYVSNMLKYDENALLNYYQDLGYENVKIRIPKIKKNSLIIFEGFPMRLRGVTEANNLLKGNLQLKLDSKSYETVRRMERFKEKYSEEKVSEKFDKLNDEDLILLYDVFVEKLSTIYRKRPSNFSNDLVEARAKFTDLKIEDKIDCLVNIINTFSTKATNTSNLKLIGNGSSQGSMKVSKNTLCKGRLVLVNQSVTGLFENRVQL